MFVATEVFPSCATPTYTHSVQDYFNRRALARPSQPLSNSVILEWHASPPSLSHHGVDVLNVFLNIFHRNIPHTFPLFDDISIEPGTRPDFVLAAAAVGGLYCRVKNSFEFSKAMFNDSRRSLFTSVSPPFVSLAAYWLILSDQNTTFLRQP